MGKTSIEWTEQTWNPLRGCSPISEGCRNCYAERVAARFSGDLPFGKPGPFSKFASMSPSGPRWTGRVELIPDMLDIPLRRRKPTTYFVNSMSDLFHESLPDEAIDRVFAVMALCPQHRFICLTKRAARMAEWATAKRRHFICEYKPNYSVSRLMPFENVILGVSCEDQAAADERIPHLLMTPAACRMASLEPLLGPIDLKRIPGPPDLYRRPQMQNALTGWAGNDSGVSVGLPRLDWVIVGGESGPGARPMHPDSARSLRDQCTAAGVSFFFKQWGEWLPAGQDGAPGDNQVLNCLDCEIRVGKKAAGRLLDGRVWDERPGLLTLYGTEAGSG